MTWAAALMMKATGWSRSNLSEEKLKNPYMLSFKDESTKALGHDTSERDLEQRPGIRWTAPQSGWRWRWSVGSFGWSGGTHELPLPMADKTFGSDRHREGQKSR